MSHNKILIQVFQIKLNIKKLPMQNLVRNQNPIKNKIMIYE